jgi:hypothetical protein
MYSACLYCQGYLGRNELLPRFPVGKRLAFDSAKGRLWVICGSCARWNLSPLEERWESIDECERQFRRTRIRVSTPNIGLVELPEGTTLIRIGKPLFPEFAAWRYGRRFTRRRMKTGLAAGTVVSGALGATLGAVAAGFGGAAFIAAYAAALWIVDEGPKRRPVTSLRLADRLLHLKQDDAEATRVFADGEPGAYGLALHHTEGVELIRGPEVRRVLGKVVPTLSPFGGAHDEIRSAIELVDNAGSAEECVTRTLARATRYGGWFAQFPVETRLALEMSLQEDTERRALDGELTALEKAWREAEQIAAIADSLLMPGDVLERIAGLRKGIRSPGYAFS